MTNVNVTDETTVTTTVAEVAEVAEVVEAAKVAVKKPRAPRKRVAKGKTKMELARAVVRRFSRGKTINRAKVLEVLQNEVKLTPKGASTYYQKLRSELGKPSA